VEWGGGSTYWESRQKRIGSRRGTAQPEGQGTKESAGTLDPSNYSMKSPKAVKKKRGKGDSVRMKGERGGERGPV